MKNKIMVLGLILVSFLNVNAKEGELVTEEEQFALASELFAKGDNEKSYYEYEKFLNLFKDSKKAVKSQYMLGECIFAESLKRKGEKEIQVVPPKDSLSPQTQFSPSFRKAIEEYNKVIKIYPAGDLTDDVYFRIAECYFNNAEYQKATEKFKEFITEFPNSYLRPEAFYNTIIICLIQSNKVKDIENLLQELITKFPYYANDEKVYFILGVINFQKQDFKTALEHLKKVNSPEGLYLSGICLDKLKEYFQAVISYKKIISDFPDNEYTEKAYFSMAESFYSYKEYFSAITSYKKFLDKFPESELKAYILFKIGCSNFLQKKFQQAIEYFEESSKTFPNSEVTPWCIYMLAESLRKMEKLTEANGDYEKLIDTYATNEVAPYAQYKKGWCFFIKETYPESLQVYTEFLKRFDKHLLAPYVYFLSGTICYYQQKYKESINYFKLALDKCLVSSDLYEITLYMLNKSGYEMKDFASVINSRYIINALKPTENIWRARTYLLIGESYYRMKIYKESYILYDMVVKNFPNTQESLYATDGIAWIYNDEGKFNMAEKERQKILEQISLMEDKKGVLQLQKYTEFEIANNLFNQKKYLEALDYYEKFAKEHPKDSNAPLSLYRSALCYYKLEYYSSAIKSWETLVEKYKGNTKIEETLYQIADTYFKAGKYQEAVKTYNNLLTGYPQSEYTKEVKLRIAQSYYNAKDDDNAIKEFKKYIDSYPDDPQIFSIVEMLEFAQQRKSEATKGGATVVSSSSDSIDVLRDLLKKEISSKVAAEIQYKIGKKFFDNKQYDNAIEEFLKIMIDYSESPVVALAQFYMAESYYKQDKFEEAVREYDKFMHNFPQNENIAEGLFHKAISNYNLKKYEDAALVYKELLTVFPNSDFTCAALFNMALSYKKGEKISAASAAYLEFYNKYPQDANASTSLLEVGNIYQRQKRYKEAIECYKKVTLKGKDERSIEIQHQIGDCYIKLEKVEDAIQELTKLRSLQPLNNTWRLAGLIKLAEIYEKQNKNKEAIEIYNEVISNTNDKEWLNVLQMRIQAIKGQSEKPQK